MQSGYKNHMHSSNIAASVSDPLMKLSPSSSPLNGFSLDKRVARVEGECAFRPKQSNRARSTDKGVPFYRR